MEKRLQLITGNPGSGKTTALLKVVDSLKAQNYRVGGMVSREVRISGSRVGFEITNVDSGRKGWLAKVNQKSGPRVGRYRVNLQDLDEIGVDAILHANESLDLVAIDEIGPMELFSEQFRSAVTKVVEGNKPAVCTVHWNLKDSMIDDVKKREDAEMHVVTLENREHIHEAIAQKVSGFLARASKKAL